MELWVKAAAGRLAKEIIKRKLRLQGIRPSQTSIRDINTMAYALVKQDTEKYIKIVRLLDDFYNDQLQIVEISTILV